MSEEQDSWIKDALGLDLGAAAARVKEAAVTVVGDVKAVQAQVEGAFDAAISQVTNVASGVVNTVTGAACRAQTPGPAGPLPEGERVRFPSAAPSGAAAETRRTTSGPCKVRWASEPMVSAVHRPLPRSSRSRGTWVRQVRTGVSMRVGRPSARWREVPGPRRHPARCPHRHSARNRRDPVTATRRRVLPVSSKPLAHSFKTRNQRFNRRFNRRRTRC